MQRALGLEWLCIATIAVGCASAGSPSAEPGGLATAEVPRCTVVVPEAGEEMWREVRATRFTFCVPVNWRPLGAPARGGADARTWRGGTGSITWGTGEHRPRRIATAQVIVRAGEPLPSAPPGQVRRFTEVIDERVAQLWDNEFEGKHYTGATWSRPAVYLEGEATDPATARLQLAVYRTVRFTVSEEPAPELAAV